MILRRSSYPCPPRLLALCAVAATAAIGGWATAAGQNSIELFGGIEDDVVRLRWVPSEVPALRGGQASGYVLLRALDGPPVGGAVVDSVYLEHAPLDSFASLPEITDNAIAIGEILYDSVDLADDILMDSYLPLLSLALDLDYDASILVGLGYEDASVSVGSTYAYQVQLAADPTVRSAWLTVDPTRRVAYPRIPAPAVDRDRRGAYLRWTHDTTTVFDFVGYHVDRQPADSSASWRQLSEFPLLISVGEPHPDTSVRNPIGTYRDSTAQPQEAYRYRVRGIGRYRRHGTPSPAALSPARPPALDPAVITAAFTDSVGRAYLQWTLPPPALEHVSHLRLSGG